MGSIFRSEPMVLLQLLERNDSARDVIQVLGELGVMQFKDLNAGVNFYKRTFSDEVRRCQDISRVINYLEKEIDGAGLTRWPRDPSAALTSLGELEPQLRQLQREVKSLTVQELHMLQSQNTLKEHLAALRLGSSVYDKGGSSRIAADGEPTGEMELGMGAALLNHSFTSSEGHSEGGLLRCVVGTIPRTSAMSFEKLVYRMARGNCVVHSLPIEEPMMSADTKAGGMLIPKNVILVFFSGAVLQMKVLKIATYFGLVPYIFPESRSSRDALQAQVMRQLVEMSDVVRMTQRQKRYALESIVQKCEYWRHVCSRELATLHTLNLLSFDIKNRVVFVAEGWVPISRVGEVRAALEATAAAAGRETQPIVNMLETRETPPTHLPTNKFTAGFQALVNTYGYPRYREVNPGAFAIILFPFLFAIMFGDVGHGTLLLLLASFLIRNEETMGKQKLDDIIGMVFGGRYVLLLNAAFAIYVGFIYNEVFSVPMGIFGSSWRAEDGASEAVWDGNVVAFGIDPAWVRAANKMTFFNSFKMKVAIVFGVAQMTLGIILSLLNHLEFRDVRSVWFQFVPEIVFFLSIFGYLVILILLKWSTDWASLGKQPPSLLNVLISMFMAPGTYTEQDRLFDDQEHYQLLLLIVALLAVPMLLVPKPLLAYLDLRRKQLYSSVPDESARGLAMPPAEELRDAAADEDEDDEGHESEEIGEIVVHQVIHTIEFVLGSISNTASYLRLWALSLAHSQLSELFWSKVMVGIALAPGVPAPFNAVVTFGAFAIWTCLHLGVLMVMENLSSFLHALRLQWVEFQNKFYSGDGKPFMPFAYSRLDLDDE